MQLPAYKGRLRQFTLTPRGDIDGLILGDGMEVKVPPGLSTALAYALKPGDAVTVHGLRAAALPMIQAASITADASGQTIVDRGQAGPKGRGPRAPAPAIGAAPIAPGALRSDMAPTASGLVEARGRIRMALHGGQGEVDGALLDDGTVLRLPPPEALRLVALLHPGQTVVATGTGFANPLGKVVQVWQIGSTRAQLSQVEKPPGRGEGGGGRDRRAGAPQFDGGPPPPPSAAGAPPPRQP